MIERETASTDPAEVSRFSAMADRWWDPSGPMAQLHRLNPVRIGYIRDRLCSRFNLDHRSIVPLKGFRVLDVGCGCGLLSEPLARMGADVTAIDPSAVNIEAAQDHAAKGGVDVDYRHVSVEEIAGAGERFHVVVSMEVVEHVADLNLFLDSCSRALDTGGAMILSTLNRTPKAFLFGIVGAEYILRWVPRGTHDWRKFVRPSELGSALRRNGVTINDISGLSFNPRLGEWQLSPDVAINYLVSAEKRQDR